MYSKLRRKYLMSQALLFIHKYIAGDLEENGIM